MKGWPIRQLTTDLKKHKYSLKKKQAAIKQFTTPAQTSAQFFESKLPGFERRFEASPFFKLEQERTEREGEAEVAEQQREESRLETERRRKLRGGVGAGRGRTIVTRGRA